MNVKLATPEQVANLSVGNTISRYPSHGAPETLFDAQKKSLTDTYRIHAINKSNGMVELIASGHSLKMFAPAGDIARLFIHFSNLSSQKIWWVEQ